LQGQYSDAQAQLALDTGNKNTQGAIVSMNDAATAFESTNPNISGKNVGATSADAAQTAIQNIDTSYNQTASTLPNNDVTDKQLLAAQRTYAEATVVHDYETNNLVASLIGANNLDPRTPQQVAQAANDLIKTFQSNSIPNESSSDLITSPIETSFANQPTLQTQYAADNAARIAKLQAALKVTH
jgi:hypothetical protein